MNRRKTMIVGLVAFACGAISFFDARSTALSDKASSQWLKDPSKLVVALEEQFNRELTGLIAKLMDRQKSLGLALEDPCTPDRVILQRSENVIVAHEHLMSRTGDHVIELRGKLAADNREHLMRLCAETLRGPVCRMNGQGRGRGMGNGRGYGYGPGRGRGFGTHRGICNRLANCLSLDEGQVSLMHEKDPGFEAETAQLREALLAERAKLLSMFEDSKSDVESLKQQIERLITAHSSIERRIVRQVLVLRPYLTVEQQKWLIGLCRRSQGNS